MSRQAMNLAVTPGLDLGMGLNLGIKLGVTLALTLALPRVALAQPGATPGPSPGAALEVSPAKSAAPTPPKPGKPEPAKSEPNGPNAAKAGGEADADSRVADLEKRVEELESRATSPEGDGKEEPLRTYGFADVGYRKVYPPDTTTKGLFPSSSTFVLGSLNYYFDAQPLPNFRALTEVRFSLYPLGASNSDLSTVSTGVQDITSPNARNIVYWSGIILERAQLEWNRYDLFKVRAGYFLTPYGIWNEDHGSPVLISSAMPEFFVSEFFPTHQLGVQALGNGTVGDWELGYRAYVTNGRNPGQTDVDKSKNLGARLTARRQGDYTLTLGTSAFAGTIAGDKVSLTSTSPLTVDRTQTVEGQEWGAAGDVSFDYKKLRVRAEFVLNRQSFTEGKRPRLYNGVDLFQPDTLRWSSYALVAYGLPWAGLEPYAYAELNSRNSMGNELSSTYSVGLNVRFNPSAMFKFQPFWVQVYDTPHFPHASDQSFFAWDMRFVMSF